MIATYVSRSPAALSAGKFLTGRFDKHRLPLATRIRVPAYSACCLSLRRLLDVPVVFGVTKVLGVLVRPNRWCGVATAIARLLFILFDGWWPAAARRWCSATTEADSNLGAPAPPLHPELCSAHHHTNNAAQYQRRAQQVGMTIREAHLVHEDQQRRSPRW